MLLNEIFFSNYEYDWTSERAATFQTSNNIIYVVKFFPYGKDVEVMFQHRDTNTGKTSISVTGTGDAFKILSTVIEIIKDYLNLHKMISRVIFSSNSNETSRVKLYHKLCNSFSNKKCQIDDNGTEIFYTISTKD